MRTLMPSHMKFTSEIYKAWTTFLGSTTTDELWRRNLTAYRRSSRMKIEQECTSLAKRVKKTPNNFDPCDVTNLLSTRKSISTTKITSREHNCILVAILSFLMMVTCISYEKQFEKILKLPFTIILNITSPILWTWSHIVKIIHKLKETSILLKWRKIKYFWINN